jgi:16S rRNA (cytidine1402-2'-O)-methyltransferase
MMTATLYLIPTPIGNMEDMTFRAIRILKEVKTILAEDTRVSGKLLKHYGISGNMQSYHQHNEHQVTPQLTERLLSGESMALITDAGTPGISDPGFLIVREAIKAGIKIETLPGATAFIPALVGSGLPSDRFVFEGFLPPKKGRTSRLTKLAEIEYTVILYESPHRLIKTLDQLQEYFGKERQVCVCREISKLHEEYIRGTLMTVSDHFRRKGIKGEIVIIVEGKK